MIAVPAAAERRRLDGGAAVEWTLLAQSRPLERLEGALRARCEKRGERVEVVNIERGGGKVASGHELNMKKPKKSGLRSISTFFFLFETAAVVEESLLPTEES